MGGSNKSVPVIDKPRARAPVSNKIKIPESNIECYLTKIIPEKKGITATCLIDKQPVFENFNGLFLV